MALIYDGIGEQYLPIQRPVSGTFSNPWILFVKFFPVQQIDIRPRGSVFIFKNLSATALAEFFTLEQHRQTNDRAGYIIRWNTTANDLVSVVPYYDFTRVQIWTEAGTGL